LVKIIPEPSTTRYMAFKVIRSNIEIAITAPRIARLRSVFTEFHDDTGDTLQMFKVNGQRSRSHHRFGRRLKTALFRRCYNSAWLYSHSGP